MNSTQMMVQADLLEIAGSMLERYDMKDILEPGFLETSGNSQYGMASSSGLNDYDYQNLSNLSLGQKQLNQVQTVNKIPIPTEILEHFKHIKCHCMMGLFPEIGRAWLTIDSEIYIWTYEHTRDVAYYDGLSQLITSVGLVKTKSGVFIENIKYLLILTTAIEIVVLGVTFGDNTKAASSPARNMKGKTSYEEMQLMSKPIFVINSDNSLISVVKGSACGRIFLGGKDGCLYEIAYQAESSWFGKRCKKLNHSQGLVSLVMPSFLKVFSEVDAVVNIEIDDSRNILYILTEKGSIEAWEIGREANNMRRICKSSYSEIANNACNIMKTIDPTVFKTIKSICPLSEEDNPNLNIIAVTECGVRLYFSTNPPATLNNTFSQQIQQQQLLQQSLPQNLQHNSPNNHSITPNYQHGSAAQNMLSVSDSNRPQGLYLRHIRLPPGYTPNTTINKPRKVHLAYHKDGTLILVSTPQQDQDILWSISSAPFPNRTFLTESTTVLPLDGIVWSIGEIKDRCKAKLHSLLRKAQTPKKIALLTNQGAHIIALLKPVDILHQLLMACQGPHHEAVKAFFQVQTEREACATSLLLACSEQYRGTDIAMWAAQAFMLYGGEPSYQHQMLINTHGMMGGHKSLLNSTSPILASGIDRSSPQMFMSTPMPNQGSPSIYRPLQTPQQNTNQQSTYPLSPITSQNVYGSNVPSINDPTMAIFSAKHDGLYLYVARLLRPIWRMRCTDDNLQSALSQEDCALILDEMYSIKAFLEANSINEISLCATRSNYHSQSFTNGYNTIVPNLSINPDQRDLNDQAQAEEKRSLTALNHFIKHTCEVLALWKILCEHQFQILASDLTKEQQSGLRSSTFRELVLSRFDLCVWLIVALINSYLNDDASVSAISSKLRELCPTLYRHEDAVTFKATEILMLSKTCNNVEEREEKLRTALQLCKDAAPSLPLQTICQQFTLANFHEGVIELCAACATKSDPEEYGVHFYNNDEPTDDREGYAAFATRMNYYKEVRVMLDSVYQTICNANFEDNASNQISNANVPVISSNAQMMRIVKMAVQAKDPILHAAVYEWLMMHDMMSELLALSETSLGEFLRRSVVRNPDNLKLIDLLWKYYEKNGHHSEAARILDNLATMESDDVSLVQRIEYLARAVMCMRNEGVGYSVANGVLLKELEDKLEIARVQKSVLDAMIILGNVNRSAAKAVNDLNRSLFDITQLYQNFADPFDLWESKLTILNCSHHNDPLLIETVWSQIINKTVEGAGTANERSIRLFTKIENLVREFGESGHCFPLAFLIRELEIKACQLRLPEGIVPEKLVGMNLDLELLLEYYLRMISMNERVWANEGNEWHLVQSSIRVVLILANNANTMWIRSKRRILGKAQDIVSTCLNLCYQKPGTERLQQDLKDLQCRMQRIST